MGSATSIPHPCPLCLPQCRGFHALFPASLRRCKAPVSCPGNRHHAARPASAGTLGISRAVRRLRRDYKAKARLIRPDRGSRIGRREVTITSGHARATVTHLELDQFRPRSVHRKQRCKGRPQIVESDVLFNVRSLTSIPHSLALMIFAPCLPICPCEHQRAWRLALRLLFKECRFIRRQKTTFGVRVLPCGTVAMRFCAS
jgi:hypothetical protein